MTKKGAPLERPEGRPGASTPGRGSQALADELDGVDGHNSEKNGGCNRHAVGFDALDGGGDSGRHFSVSGTSQGRQGRDRQDTAGDGVETGHCGYSTVRV